MKNIKAKSTLGLAIIYAVIIGIVNLLIFTVSNSDARNGVFWLSYGFMMAAFAVQIVCMVLSFKGGDVEAVFFGIPLASFSVFYLGAALLVGAVFMIFSGAAPFILALVLQVLLLGVFVVIAAVTVLSRDVTQHVAENVKEKVMILKSVLCDVETARDSAGDKALKASLEKLCETVRYSDPMSTDAVKEIEESIVERVTALKTSVAASDTEEATRLCRELEMLWAERNKKLAISK
ncbi:MAG: hypothetical protein E7647_01595 [Ruminococcaceae bacterium]|nr:hypothetical protein [Oscillospiraceae bacterium]